MKKNFTKAMLLTLTVVGMGMFNSCKDHDLCVENDVEIGILKDKNAKLEDVVKTQADKLQDLAEQIAAIKQCGCTLTREEVQEMIDAALNQPSAEFTETIINIINQGGFQTAEQVQDAIEAYNAANPGAGLTAQQIQDMINTAVENLASQEALDQAVATLTEAVNKANGDIANLGQTVNDLNNAATEAIAKLETVAADVETLKTQLADAIAAWGPKVEQALADAAAAKAQAQTNSDKITTLEQALKDLAEGSTNAALKMALDSLANEMQNFATKEALRDVLTAAELMHSEAVDYTKRVEAMATERLGDLESKYTALEATVNDLKAKVDEIYPMVQKNTQAIEAMQGYLNKLITNIIVQRVSNPVFGSFAFPWGVQSNILMGYYGESDVAVKFPTIRTANYIYKENALTDKDAEMLGQSVESYSIAPQSTIIDETEGNAGKVYLTINPTNVDFEGTTFSLVNSQDVESPVKLGTITKSEETLKFGVTRAAENGFYEAPATFTAENIPATGVNKTEILENLKVVAKDVLTYKDGVDVKEVANRLFNVLSELDCELDANGVKAAWTTNGETQSVYSKYDVAAFALKPLSYAFLYDANIGTAIGNKIPSLPVISPITEGFINDLIDLDDLNVQLNLDLSDLDFTIAPIDVVIPEIEINFENVVIDDLGVITAEVDMPVYDVVMVNGEPTLIQTTTRKEPVQVDASNFKTAIQDAIDDALAEAGESIGEEIQEQLDRALEEQLAKAVENIQNSVNDLIQNQLANKINGELNGAIKDVMDQVADQVTSGIGNYVDKANGYINQLNSWTGRLNDYMSRFENALDNLNARLQVTMLYSGADGMLHQLSNDKNYPTVFGGSGVATIYTTSYTGEIIAPAAKKFVGVTNVFKDGSSAQEGCADCKAALDAVNSGEYLNKVLPGSRYGIAVENMKAGYTYELFYSGLDYSGKISARKFYVTVK